MTPEEILDAVRVGLLLGGWLLLVGFGIVMYVSMRGLPKEVMGARMFLNLDKVARGFLFLSIGFSVIFAGAIPGALGHPEARLYAQVVGSAGWLTGIFLAAYYLFRSFHVPRSVRRKFGAHAQPQPNGPRAGGQG
jgi:hypothetical protein